MLLSGTISRLRNIKSLNNSRYKRALWTTIANFGSRVISMILLLLTVRWALPYLGQEQFGVLMTIMSFSLMLNFMDLGIGNSLLNRTSGAASRNDRLYLSEVITGGLGVLFIVSCAISVILVIAYVAVPWSWLIKTSDAKLSTQIDVAIAAFLLMFSLSIFGGGIARVFHGLQEGFTVYLYNFVGTLVSIIVFWFATKYEASVGYLVAILMGGLVFSNLMLLLPLARRGLIRVKGCKESTARQFPHLWNTGLMFLLIQVGTMIGWGADSLIISSLAGAASVAAYAVAQRLCQFILQPLSMVNNPLWSAYADAKANDDRQFVRRTLLRSMALTFGVSSVLGGVVVVLGNWIIFHWTKNSIVIDASLLFAFAIWTIMLCCGNAFAMFLNGVGLIREQAYVVGILIIIAWPLKFALTLKWGAVGTIYAGAIGYGAAHVIGYLFCFRKSIERNI